MKTILTVMLVLCLSSMAFGATNRFVNVSGICQKKVMPDRARIVLTVSELQPDVNSASKKAMNGYEELRRDIKKLNLKDGEFETSEYSVQEDTEWVNNKRNHRGYRARMGLSVSTSEISKISDIIVLAAKHNVQDVGAMSTYLSQEKMKSTHESCLKEAITNARQKAEQMAASVGGHVGDVISIEENPRGSGGEPRYAVAMDYAPAAKSAQLAPEIESKPEEISVSIGMSVELK